MVTKVHTINIRDDDDVLSKTDAITSSEDDEEKSLCMRLLKMWKTFGDNTSMHGLGRATNSSRIWKKVVWTILVLVAAVFSIRNCYETFQDYFSYPVTTSVIPTMEPFFYFPSVTLCNLNPYRYHYLKQEIRDAIEEDIMAGKSVQYQQEHFFSLFNSNYNVSDLPQNITHSMKEMLVGCQFTGRENCNESDFIEVPNIQNGLCFTFFPVNNYWYAFRPGNKNGLVLELDVQQDEYLPFTPAAGVKVLVHPEKEVPFAHEDGFVVRPGVSTSIGVRKIEMTHQIPPWGDCINEEDTKNDFNMFMTHEFNGYQYGYSQKACEKTCFQYSLQLLCDCCDASYPCFSGMGICNMSQKDVRECYNIEVADYNLGNLWCSDSCRTPCQETKYQTSYSVAAWPSENYADNFNRSTAKWNLERSRTSSMTIEHLRKHFVRLEVYFETMTKTSIVASPAYNWSKLLSDLGGQLGLWMGFSLMTAIEFLELGLDFIRKLCFRPFSPSRTSDSTKC